MKFCFFDTLKAAAACTVAVAIFAGGTAHAVPLTAGLTVTGEVDYLPFPATEVGSITNTGTAEVLEGGVLTTTGISGTTQTVDPLMGTLTDSGDGVGLVTTTSLDSSASGDEFDYTAILNLVIMNTTLLPIGFDLVLDVDISSDADGTDALADYDLDLEETAPATGDFVLINVLSDTIGDALDVFLGGGPDTEPDPASSGALVTLTDSFTFPVSLGAGATLSVDAVIAWTGELFDAGGDATVTQDVFLSIVTSTPGGMTTGGTTGGTTGTTTGGTTGGMTGIPGPGSVGLIGLGLIALGFFRTRRTA